MPTLSAVTGVNRQGFVGRGGKLDLGTLATRFHSHFDEKDGISGDLKRIFPEVSLDAWLEMRGRLLT